MTRIANFVTHDFTRFLETRAGSLARTDPPIPAESFMTQVAADIHQLTDQVRSTHHDYQQKQGTRLRRLIKRLEDHRLIAYLIIGSLIISQIWFWIERFLQIRRAF